MDNYSPTISFRLINGELLESGYLSNCQFTQQGGIIGSDAQADWVLQDTLATISATQCAITWQDKRFCLTTLSEPVYINHAEIPKHVGAISLSQSDQIKIGQLLLSVNIHLTGQPADDLMSMAPQSLVSVDSNPLESLFESAPTQSHHAYSQSHSLAPTLSAEMTCDPLQALDNESLSLIQPSPLAEKQASSNHDASMLASPLSDNRGNRMVQEFMDLPHIQSSQQETSGDVDHVAINPLMQGLGLHLQLQDSQQAHDFLIELGKTTKAAIEGLLTLQTQLASLQDKQLRPIEDNPLRLNTDYAQTMRLMFTDERSPVHLAAPSAVAESLHHMQLHAKASQEAISVALSTLLEAFSPAHLLKRFAHYRRGADNSAQSSAWAWEMYTQYYQELTSSRQQGFEKLFDEVYTHAYDRALRKGLDEA